MIPVYKSESQKQLDQNKFAWHKVFTNTDTLADQEDDKKITVSIYKYSSEGSHFKLTSYELHFEDIKDKPQELEKTNAYGKIKFTNINTKERASFLDYISNGCKFNLHLNIDFTESNKPDDGENLHQ